MGMYIYMHAVSAKAVQETFNSNNLELLQKIAQDEYTDSDIICAVQHIITGQDRTLDNYLYNYALIELCGQLRHKDAYDEEIKLGVETDWINRVLKEDFSVTTLSSLSPQEDELGMIEMLLMGEATHQFDIAPAEDFPIINQLSYDTLKAIQPKFAHIDITDDQIILLQNSTDKNQVERGYAYAHIQGIINTINLCVANKLDLMVYLH